MCLTTTQAILLRMPNSTSSEEQLFTVLERARTAGFFGPGPIRVHADHAMAFGQEIPLEATTLLDLGSGGGLPGLPLFVRLPHLSGVLLDASEKRCAFLSWAVAELGLSERVEVHRGRAEELGHQPELREGFDAVTCRGFGPPAATIEAAVGFMSDGGTLVISEPPERREWDPEVLSEVGLRLEPSTRPELAEARVVAFRRTGAVSAIYPRPLRKQRSRPLVVVR